MQDYIYLHKSPQKNNISIRQNDNTLIITYFLYSQLLSHLVQKVRFLRILRICKFSKFAVFAIFARYLSRPVLIYDNLNNIPRTNAVRGLGFAHCHLQRSLFQGFIYLLTLAVIISFVLLSKCGRAAFHQSKNKIFLQLTIIDIQIDLNCRLE